MTKSYKFGSCFLTVWAATLACSQSAELAVTAASREFQVWTCARVSATCGEHLGRWCWARLSFHNSHVQPGGWSWRGDGGLRE